ncbi:tyrosine-type recombinase/integrase [Sphingomonas canadensis]|uniref:Tyrosine-type recombinase/integrase n=1 Tax=Sphingomonas canadensis TaxID=1219257 RepID=A0ABW3HAA0_9SPHN|nr:integrase arm-type DNA-binding domain-containing protein [Sphingomonas canadensis]MCW3837788.1 integrase arm-type DNA-binding domain-containing protein [Sphingomonas canadensis]
MPLTVAAVKAAAPRDRAYKLHDTGGLFLFVSPAGARSWRLKYRFGGAEKLLTIGRYPDIGLGDARARRDQARLELRDNVDPGARNRRQGGIISQNFEPVARAWHAARRGRWSAAHAADVLASLERDVFPAIGTRPIAAISPAELLELLGAVERRGRIETARRIAQRIAGVFAFARLRGMIATNPAADLRAELRPRPPARRHPAITDPAAARTLLDAVDALPGAPVAKLASRFLALTAVRMAAVRLATWSEIHDLDGEAPYWRVPAAHMKLAAAKKAAAEFDHIVPLAPAAAAVLREAAKFGHDTRTSPAPAALIFPGRGAAPIGEGAIGALYARAGFKGRHVPHGWRAAFSTILNERAPESRAAIDQALAHTPANKVEAAYNRAEHLQIRRRLFETWSELLTAG